MTQGNGARRTRRADPPALDTRVRDSYIRALEADAERSTFAAEKFGWSPETLRRYEIGWWACEDRGRYTIPILDGEGLIPDDYSTGSLVSRVSHTCNQDS